MQRTAGSSSRCGSGVALPRLVSFLLALLLAAAPHRAAAQWVLSADVTAPRFSGGSSRQPDGRSFRPYRPTLAGVGLERSGRAGGVGLHGYYASASLALEGADAVVAVKNALDLYGASLEVSGRLATLGTASRLMLYAGPLVEVWRLAEETSRVRGGFAAAIGLQVSIGNRWSVVMRAGAAVSGSPFAAEDLDAGFVPRPLWRREVSGRLRYRL